MAYDGRAVANLLLDLADTLGLRLTHMAVHKIAFFAHGWRLADRNEPLIRQQFEAWNYGPVRSRDRRRRPRKEDRRTIEAIIWRLNNGACQWRREIPQNRRAGIPHFILIQSRPNPLGGLTSARLSRSRSTIS